MFDFQAQPSCRSSLYFHDGVRSVDFMLVWDDLSKQATTVAAEEKRRVFEKNLQREGKIFNLINILF